MDIWDLHALLTTYCVAPDSGYRVRCVRLSFSNHLNAFVGPCLKTNPKRNRITRPTAKMMNWSRLWKMKVIEFSLRPLCRAKKVNMWHPGGVGFLIDALNYCMLTVIPSDRADYLYVTIPVSQATQSTVYLYILEKQNNEISHRKTFAIVLHVHVLLFFMFN